MSTSLDSFSIELQRLYGLERSLEIQLEGLATDVSIETLDGVRIGECRDRLFSAIDRHREETTTHSNRLEAVFEAIGERPTNREVAEYEGWLADTQQFTNIVLNDAIRPLYYLGAMLALEELERSSYELAIGLAATSGHSDIVDVLEGNLDDEYAMLADLEDLADGEPIDSLLEAVEVDSNDRRSLDRGSHGLQSITVETLDDIVIYQLAKTGYAEESAVDLFETMAEGVESDDLADIFDERSRHARARTDRLEKISDALGMCPTSSRCHTADGIVDARHHRLETADGHGDRIDLETCLTVERLQRRQYEGLRLFASRLDPDGTAVSLLEQTATEQRNAIEELESLEALCVIPPEK